MEPIDIKVLSVNISEQKGTIKHPVETIELTANGIPGDAHAGSWHRQISLLGDESVQKFSKMAGRSISFGEFAENITTQGMELYHCKPLDMLISDEVSLQVTQIGKECHGHSCAIFREVGNCVMPKEGIFARVIRPGMLKPGDILRYYPKLFKIRLITLSDRASSGEYDDRSGPAIEGILRQFFENLHYDITIDYSVIPDDDEMLDKAMKMAREQNFDFVFTTGGTGIGPKDITVEVVKQHLDKEIPGIMDMIRLKFGADKPNALISRSVAGVMGNSIVYTLPGSLKAVQEYMGEITKTMMHLVFMMHSIDNH